MKRLLTYISIFIIIAGIVSCSTVEMPEDSYGIQTVEFVVRPTTFSNFDVSVTGTKALEGEALTEVEQKIVNAYFLVFDKDGNRVDFKVLTPSGNQIPSQTLTHDYGNGPIKVCYLANVSATVAESYATWNDVLTKPLAITYPEYNAEYFSTGAGHIGIPTLNGELCFPMFGTVTFPGTTANNGVVEVQLKRLFAKVVVNLKTELDADFLEGLFDAPEINLFSYTITNLPTNVLIADVSRADSPWNTQSGTTYFKEPISVDVDDITINNNIFSTFTHILTVYVPEYYLEGTAEAGSNTDQKLKPQMYASGKRPVYLTIDGLAHQTNYVDVPLKYNIYFGGDATGNFDLLRNVQYNNNMTITGTTEAILGEDDRVDATYHNLANPDNIGEDVPANCYIISKPGRYLIPMCKGNQPTNLLSGTSAEIVHINHLNSAQNSIPNNKISIQTINGKQYIQFDVNMYDAGGNLSLTDVVPSNELLCLKDSNGNIVWSWHLWMCDDNNRPEEYNHTYPVSSAIALNRAVGALNYEGFELLGYSLAQWDDGLYYQWGRKDPMLPNGNPTASSSTYAKSVQNPRTFYTDWNASGAGWASAKTINDPCPPGYKVPSNKIWRTSGNASTGLEDIMEDLGLDGYPYNLQSNGGFDVNIVYPYSSYVENTGSKKPFSSISYNGNVQDREIVSGVTATMYFSGERAIYTGDIWSSEGGLYFSRTRHTIDDGAQIFINVNLGGVDRWFPRDPSSSADGYTIGTIQTNLLKAVGEIRWVGTIAKRLLEAALNAANINIDNLIRGILEGQITVTHEYDPKLKTDSDALPVSRGAHVRCVREDSPVQ